MKNMKVGTRLVLGFLLLSVMGAVIAALGVYNMSRISDDGRDLYDRQLQAVAHIKDVNTRTMALGRALRNAILSSTEPERDFNLEEVANIRKSMDESLGQARTLFNQTEQGRKEFGELENMLKEFDKLTKEAIDLLLEERVDDTPRPAADFLASTFRLTGDQVDEKLVALSQMQEVAARNAAEGMNAVYVSSRNFMLALVAGSVLIGMALGVVITRSLTRQLGGEPAYAVQIAERIAEGDLTVKIDLRDGDQGSILFAIRKMRNSLRTIVGEVRSGTASMASASGEIAAGNLDLSARTEQQAGSLEETASSVEELTSTVKQNADNARQANQLAVSASDVASRGGAVVSQVVETMGAINDSAKKIVDIISVIDGIAFQTNILALNAAVEAARAGEQGRGFAVVAAEVRNLAQRSAAAAKEIKGLIGDSVDKVDAGARLVDQAGSTMNEVVDSVKRVTDIMAEIAAASEEQTSGIEQINQAITQMDQVTQQNASLVEEAAAAAEALKDQAGKLAELVAVFKLDEHVSGSPVSAGGTAAPARPLKPVSTAPAPAAPANVPSVRQDPAAKARQEAAVGRGNDWEEF